VAVSAMAFGPVLFCGRISGSSVIQLTFSHAWLELSQLLQATIELYANMTASKDSTENLLEGK
jgi:hypothetical protein